MFKSVFAATAVMSMSAGAAFAGPYVNVETNAGWVGDDYQAATTEFHLGYEGELGTDAGWYIQGGPALVSVDGEPTEAELSGKIGVGVDVDENVNIYGELAVLTDGKDLDDDLNVGAKFGVKWTF
jgi:outer membrane autotransporter protein|tara:strand:- start:763 stop:1137 length:375 start_codon:yes stop_codon:yes gene_type:complete